MRCTGDNGPLRTWLEQEEIAYVPAVACDHQVPAGAGHTIRADHLAARLPGKAWQRLSAGAGAKGHRWYDWAWAIINDPEPGHRHLLIRRNRRTGDLAFYRCYSPQQVTLAALVTVAGLHWTIEVGHRWCRSSCAAFSWLCSLFLVGLVFLRCPAGAGVVAGRACPAFA